MAQIEARAGRDGKRHYRVRIRKRGYPEQSATFQRKTDAERWARNTEAAIDEGRFFQTSDARRRTVADLVDDYIADVLPTKDGDRSDQERQLRWWRDELGTYTLANLTPAVIADARDKLRRGTTRQGRQRSAATVNRYLAALSRALTWAVNEKGWINDSPVRRVAKFTEPQGRVRCLTDDERKRLLAACRASASPHLYPVVVLALSTGARRGEILNLRWKDVDLKRGVIVLHKTKNRERRALMLTGAALRMMKKLSKVRRINCDYLFPNEAGEGPFNIRGPWEKAIEAAGLEDLRIHDLRHTAASYLAMSGATLAELAAILGHKTLAMVKRYTHLSGEHTSSVVERMNRQFLGR